MELGLSLGDATTASKPFGFMEKSSHHIHDHHQLTNKGVLGFCMGLSIAPIDVRDHQGTQDHDDHDDDDAAADEDVQEEEQHTTTPATSASNAKPKKRTFMDSIDPPVQLDLLPNSPVPRNPSSHNPFPWPSSDNGSSDAGSSGQMTRGFDVNKFPFVEEPEDGAAVSCSPNNSAASSFQMDFGIHSGGGYKKDFRNNEVDCERGSSSRFSDEDENGCTRKKLRLSKEQSAFLEESFKEHNTLNPKQKLALAKHLNLRPRQVEVWFQNRRARTKLKQTEVDCEYLKRCCESLTEENRRLHKELQELRALKTSTPYHMQLPATTLTMCPSCERVATTNPAPPATTTTASPTTTSTDPASKATGFPLTRPRFYPFSLNQNQSHQPTSSREK